jgi:hypothetical protein
MGSAKNLVLSLVAVLGMVLVLVLLVPRVTAVNGPAVDVHATAVQVAADSGWPVEEAVGLPQGWSAVSVRYTGNATGTMTWHAGYQTPSGTFVAVEQARDADRAWISAQTDGAAPTGTTQAGGRTWTTYERDGTTLNSMLAAPDGAGGLTTLLTGTASFADLRVVAEHLRPVTG